MDSRSQKVYSIRQTFTFVRSHFKMSKKWKWNVIVLFKLIFSMRAWIGPGSQGASGYPRPRLLVLLIYKGNRIRARVPSSPQRSCDLADVLSTTTTKVCKQFKTLCSVVFIFRTFPVDQIRMDKVWKLNIFVVFNWTYKWRRSTKCRSRRKNIMQDFLRYDFIIMSFSLKQY